MAKGLQGRRGAVHLPRAEAADILAYDADVVPVGEDQMQHIEVCRDIAGSFNHHFGETFVMPKAKVLDSSANVPGTDGEKMSKSYNNTLEVFDDAKAQRKKIMRITTDSPADGTAEGSRRATCCSSCTSWWRREPQVARDGGAVSPRRLRLRRSEEGAGRRGGSVFRRGARAARRLGRAARRRARRAEGRRREGPSEGRRRRWPALKPRAA